MFTKKPNMKSSKKRALIAVAAILIFVTGLSAQTDGVDNNYAPLVTGATAVTPSISSQSVQADGKLIINGTFTVVNGVIRPKIARLNTDGSVDTSFSCTACTFDMANTLVQADGKILVAGKLDGFMQPIVIRLNADGSQDTSYSNGMAGSGQTGAFLQTMALDGKAYVVGYQIGTFTDARTLYRLNSDGTRDTGFTPFSMNQWHSGAYFGGLSILPDGRMFFFGKSSYGYLAQVNQDGSKNMAFEGPALTPPPDSSPFPVQPFVNSFGMQSDGKSLITGMFITVNGLQKEWIARLNADGSVDSTYTPTNPIFGGINRIVKIYAGDKTLFYRTDIGTKLSMLNPDGTTDQSYVPPAQLTSINSSLPVAGDKLSVYGTFNGSQQLLRLNPDGSMDSGFTSPVIEMEGAVQKVSIQADGKALVYGDFAKVNGTSRPVFARLNTDGTLDTSFTPGAFTGGSAVSIVPQSDGKILAGGTFTAYSGDAQSFLVRLNSDGSRDSAFNPVVSGIVQTVAVQTDGKILIGGAFSSVNSTTRTKIARLNSDGTLDNTFNPTLGTASILALHVQADGKIMIGGTFSGVNGFNRTNIARLNADGTLDTAFNAGSPSTVTHISRPADGKYLILSNGLRKLNADGTTDGTFTVPTANTINAVLPMPDGSILVGGFFATINGVAKINIARLTANGSVDILFSPASTNKDVRALAAESNGNVIVGGDFTRIGNLDRTNVARLLIAPVAHATPFDFDGDGRADISVTRQADFNWYQLTGVNYNYSGTHFGSPGDIVTPADYDGDGKTDISIFHPATGDWWYQGSLDNAVHAVHWGTTGDIPIPGDFNGDGKDDLVVVRNFNWYVATSSGQFLLAANFGQAGDIPIPGDFDGDGKSDTAIFRPSTGDWMYAASGNGRALVIVHWGISTDTAVPADYDGDGKTDIAVYRASEGNWYILNSGNGSFTAIHFGVSEDRPIPADYDGDGKTDIAVYRPSQGFWYLLLTTGGYTGFPFGIASDIPTPNAYIVPGGGPRATASVGIPVKQEAKQSVKQAVKRR